MSKVICERRWCRIHSNVEERRQKVSSGSSLPWGSTDEGQFSFAGTPQALNGAIFCKYLATDEMLADILTRPFPKHRFEKLIFRS